jgi:ubiquinone/menaquinone biosynthesis C-methylase UbiE
VQPRAIDFTGERAVEGKTPQGIMHSHILRYEFAARYCKGKKVLDCACGSGYGCLLLLKKGGAASVEGWDISHEALDFARSRYKADGLTFSARDITSKEVGDHLFDLIVCFETIEHVQNPQKVLDNFASMLSTGGLLIISTPNRTLCSPGIMPFEQPWNEFHIREFTKSEFSFLLKRNFKIVCWLGQCSYPIRFTAPFFAHHLRAALDRLLETDCAKINKLKIYEEPFYLITVCRRSKAGRSKPRSFLRTLKRKLLSLWKI